MNWRGSDRAKRLPRDWSRVRTQVLARDGGRCLLAGPCCLGKATEVDHIVRGDDHRLSNLQAVCRPCHQAKTHHERGRAEPRRRPAEGHPAFVKAQAPPPQPLSDGVADRQAGSLKSFTGLES